MLIIELAMIDKADRDLIRKRLEEIGKLNPNTRQKRKILEELTDIFNDLQFKRKHIMHLIVPKDLEYIFADLDDYYKPIIVKDILRVIIKCLHAEEIKIEQCLFLNI